MINRIDKLKTYTIYLTVLLLTACGGGGGGGGGDSSETSKTVDSSEVASATVLSGVVADGYLRDARVFLDRNKNRIYDNGEPSAASGPGGQYSFEINPGEGDLYPVAVDVIGGQTVDEDNGLTVEHGYLLEAPAGRWQFISPLTTLVKNERDKNPLFTEQQVVLNVVTQLGLSDTVSVFDNYIDFTEKAGASVAGAAAAEYARTHKAARVVAKLFGQLRTSVTQNLGGQVGVGEQHLLAYMISDQIMARASAIKQALNAERNSTATMDVELTLSTVNAGINRDHLNLDLLSRYQKRLDQNLKVWDMKPPRLVGQIPAADASVPVDVVISTEFDELLDETLLGANLIELSGPNGPVVGQLEYDADRKTLLFVPDELLLPLSDYQVTINAQLTDSLGNPLDKEIRWAFKTVFSETPPPLPDIF